MAIQAGTYKLGPDNADLRVQTGRSGAAAKAGHNLTLGVTSWDATLEVGDSSSLELNADATSLEVLKGEGGAKSLDDGDKADIKKSIDKDILKKQDIQFRSSDVQTTDSGLTISGDLSIAGKSAPVSFDVSVADDGTLTAGTTLTQSNHGIKPYSALFGALKVNDDVEVLVEGKVS
ncbi:MAG: YceI family protein [Solirubrobacteraceae bacterium]